MTVAASPMIFAFIVSVGVSVLSACGPLSEDERQQSQEQLAAESAKSANKDIKGYVDYTMDARTGICFARSRMRGGYYVYSPVECTDSIKRLIVNPAK